MKQIISPPLRLSYKLVLCFPAPEGVVTHAEQNASEYKFRTWVKQYSDQTSSNSPGETEGGESKSPALPTTQFYALIQSSIINPEFHC